MKKNVFLLLSFLLASIGGILLFKRIEISSITYKSYDDAVAAEALGKYKWLPMDLPESASEIVETHDVDTNEVWFTYTSKHGHTPSRCIESTWKSVIIFNKKHSARSFVEKLNSARQSKKTKVYSCKGDEFAYYLAFDYATGQAYGWSNRM